MPAGDGGEGDGEVAGVQTRASSGHRGQRFISSEGRPASGVGTHHPSAGAGGLSEELAGPRAAPTARKAPKEGISRAMSPTPGGPTQEPTRSAAASPRTVGDLAGRRLCSGPGVWSCGPTGPPAGQGSPG